MYRKEPDVIPSECPEESPAVPESPKVKTIIITREMKKKLTGLANHTMPNLSLPNEFRAVMILNQLTELLGLAQEELVESIPGISPSLEQQSKDNALVASTIDILNRYVEASFCIDIRNPNH